MNMTTKLELFTILTLPRNGISLQTGRNHQSNRCQRRQIEKIKNTTAVSFFFLFSAPALLAVRGSPLTARSFARRSFDRSKNARKRKRLLAVYFQVFHQVFSSLFNASARRFRPLSFAQSRKINSQNFPPF